MQGDALVRGQRSRTQTVPPEQRRQRGRGGHGQKRRQNGRRQRIKALIQMSRDRGQQTAHAAAYRREGFAARRAQPNQDAGEDVGEDAAQKRPGIARQQTAAERARKHDAQRRVRRARSRGQPRRERRGPRNRRKHTEKQPDDIGGEELPCPCSEL